MKELLFKTADGEMTFTAAGYGIFIAFMVILVSGAVFFSKRSAKAKHFDTKQLIFSGVSIALAMITSMIPLYTFPFGGSVTLFSMFFICFIGYLYGPGTGLCTGIAYGILQLIVKPYIYFPMQVIIDYPLAFGALGLSGFFWKSKNGLLKGYIAGISGYYFFVVLSGCLFFAEYAWEGWNPLVYSLAYNGSYIFMEGFITVLLLAAVKPLSNGLSYIKKLALQ